MKLLTINTHSLEEIEYEKKRRIFVQTILEEKPDIIAMQEVNQPRYTEKVHREQGYIPCQTEISVRKGNHAFFVAKQLREKGLFYYWTWLPVKIGYEKYDEGLAIFCKTPILSTEQFYISDGMDYKNWKTRKVLGIQTEGRENQWFYTVHMGWWKDTEEPFAQQWVRLEHHLKGKNSVWLMGDFNCPSHIKGEGYDLITASGWQDTYLLAEQKDQGNTVEQEIDGWREEKEMEQRRMRIDYIWCNRKVPISSSVVMFNGKNRAVISDHYGVMVTIAEERGDEII